jgi:hypothetical protein
MAAFRVVGGYAVDRDSGKDRARAAGRLDPKGKIHEVKGKGQNRRRD